ncbi:MAG: SCO family protein [Balneolaceae bacterium]|nr:SCO family protein [Balneolaceae bacterium]
MKKNLSISLLIMLAFIPAALIIALGVTGESHPLIGRELTNSSILDDSANEIEILFFGYVDCASVCPLSLATIAGVVKEQERSSNIGALFIDIAGAQRNRSMSAEEYGLSFSKKIRGVTVEGEEYRSLRGDFGLVVRPEPGSSGDWIHTDHFFLVKNHSGRWVIEDVLPNSVTTEKFRARLLAINQ